MLIAQPQKGFAGFCHTGEERQYEGFDLEYLYIATRNSYYTIRQNTFQEIQVKCLLKGLRKLLFSAAAVLSTEVCAKNKTLTFRERLLVSKQTE